ncbi:Hypothetical predicted protein [Podarcis lilfordi]|uniref:Uncharacterized protein n=1 Tax=Podarcis lilfordi TaxID=74358 RepID=A0AA35KXI4_9SAUR|nr:Hypothetical predicted protein [Podarcis lilfordi]
MLRDNGQSQPILLHKCWEIHPGKTATSCDRLKSFALFLYAEILPFVHVKELASKINRPAEVSRAVLCTEQPTVLGQILAVLCLPPLMDYLAYDRVPILRFRQAIAGFLCSKNV